MDRRVIALYGKLSRRVLAISIDIEQQPADGVAEHRVALQLHDVRALRLLQILEGNPAPGLDVDDQPLAAAVHQLDIHATALDAEAGRLQLGDQRMLGDVDGPSRTCEQPGVSVKTVGRWERGEWDPPPYLKFALAWIEERETA